MAARICASCQCSSAVRPSPRALAMNRLSTAQHKLRQLVSPGNRPITFVRRLTSSGERSSRVRRAQPPAEAERVLEVHAERRQVLGQAGGRARVRALQVGDRSPQPGLSVRRRDGLLERSPVGRLHPLVKLGVVLRQLCRPRSASGAPYADVGVMSTRSPDSKSSGKTRGTPRDHHRPIHNS